MVLGPDDSGPQYLSSRSSDVILSDIRPIQLKLEALRSINTFLDEFLWNVLSTARSLVTDRIKVGVLRILPTSLGKAALLEAEVELKAYWERTGPTPKPNAGATDALDFPLQWSYELLRLKCEAYSTLNDTDEDSIAEARLSVRMREAGHSVPPSPALVAPAALYLTAVLEHVCEHVLSNISRVVSRDSSRTSATLNDLFVAICEDVTLYGTFKAMKVYDQIENLIKTSRPRRSKSIGRVAVEKLMASPHHSESSLNSGSGHSRNRGSIGDGKTTPVLSVDQRSGSRTSVDSPSTHRRAESAASGCSESLNNSSVEHEDRILNDEFDELMRSGATMKVSLTPDRLKTMEVYKEEKSRRVGRKNTNKRGAEDLSRLEKRSISNRPPLPRPVDVIAEDDEEATSTLVSSNNGRIPPVNSTPKRAGTSRFDINGRTRAISTSHVQTGSAHILPRKTSSLSAKASISMSQKRFGHGLGPLEVSDRPNRFRKISDMDPDDIMNGSDDEESEPRTLSSFRTPRPAKISKSARDLIEFLDQGPPEEFAPPLPPQSPAASSFKSTGRFQRMMSRLTGSSSSEKLREEGTRLKRTPVVNTTFNVANGAMNPPQTPVKKVPAVVVATPPPRPHPAPQSTIQQVTPPKSPINPDPSRSMQRKTSVRKKVPPIDPELESSVHNPQSPSVSRTLSDEPSRPQPLTNGKGQPNETHKPTPPPSLSPESELRPCASADTVASNDQIAFRRPTSIQPAKITVEVPASTSAPAAALRSVAIQPPPSPSQDAQLALNAAHAHSLRQLMSTATTADECRVLVDMFLARVGFPIDRSTDVDPYPSPVSSTDPNDVDLESSVIETLLGGDSSSAPSTAVHSAQPSEAGQADESEVGSSDAETYDETMDSPARPSPPKVVRDARVNRQLPPTSRLLAVA